MYKMGNYSLSFISLFLLVSLILVKKIESSSEDCRLTPVVHVLQSPGCSPLKIPSFACIGKCTSYVQVSGSKMWQTERSCMCCQESGEREASVTLNCGKGKFQKVLTKAPVDCMCRPCTAVEEGSILPQEMAGFIDGSPPHSFAVISRKLN